MIGTYNWIGWQRALVSVLRARVQRNRKAVEWASEL
jgi:hypothetical protein